MTRTPDEQPTLWLKQVPRNRIHADGVWSDKLLDNHTPVARSTTRPRADADAVTLTQMKAAAEAVIMKHFDKHDPEMCALKYAIMGYESQAQKERGR